MSKPAYWIVFVEGRDPARFTQRAAMRLYVAALKLQGIKPIVKVVGV